MDEGNNNGGGGMGDGGGPIPNPAPGLVPNMPSEGDDKPAEGGDMGGGDGAPAAPGQM